MSFASYMIHRNKKNGWKAWRSNWNQVIESPVEEHSKKPEETRRRIVELLGDVPRIELFARQRSPGWDAWGNEIGEQDEK